MSTVYVIKEDRRVTNGTPPQNERRVHVNRTVLSDVVDDVIEIQKNEQATLISIIDNKEKKKLMVTQVSFVLFTVLAGMVVGILTLLSKTGLNEVTKASLFIALLLLLVGINAINLSVIKYVAVFKREIMLSIRQLNCVRQSIARMVFAKLEGILPDDNFCEDKGESESKRLTDVYWQLYGAHIKYPINNIALRNVYLKDKDGNKVHDYRALYRSADLFAISAIFFFTLALNIAPLIVILKFHIEEKTLNGTFNDGIIFSIVVGAFSAIFIFLVWRMGRSFYATVVDPLKGP